MPDPVGDGQPAAVRELPELAPGLLRLSKASVFAGLPPRDVVVLDRLLGARRWQCGPPPTELMRPGHLYVVREGRLALFERSRSGHLVMLALLQAGAVYSSLRDAPCPYVDALVPSAVSPIPATLLERLIARYPRLGSNVAGALSERIAMLREVACVLAEPRVEDRLRARLLEIAERMGTISIAGVRISIRLTHAQWALLVGGSRESVTLAIGKLRAPGEIVMDGRAITPTWSGMGERRHRAHADAVPPARAGHAGLALAPPRLAGTVGQQSVQQTREGRAVGIERPEEPAVDILDDGHGLIGEPRTLGRHHERPRTTIPRVRATIDEALVLERAQDLRGHHRIGTRMPGEVALAYRGVLIQPGQGGEQHELDVGQAEGTQRSPLGRLPRVCDTPQRKPGALVGIGKLADKYGVIGHCRAPSSHRG